MILSSSAYAAPHLPAQQKTLSEGVPTGRKSAACPAACAGLECVPLVVAATYCSVPVQSSMHFMNLSKAGESGKGTCGSV